MLSLDHAAAVENLSSRAGGPTSCPEHAVSMHLLLSISFHPGFIERETHETRDPECKTKSLCWFFQGVQHQKMRQAVPCSKVTSGKMTAMRGRVKVRQRQRRRIGTAPRGNPEQLWRKTEAARTKRGGVVGKARIERRSTTRKRQRQMHPKMLREVHVARLAIYMAPRGRSRRSRRPPPPREGRCVSLVKASLKDGQVDSTLQVHTEWVPCAVGPS